MREFAWRTCRMMAFVLLLVSRADGVELESTDARAYLATFLDGLISYQADFTQEVRNERGDIVETGAGEFLLHRPGRFLWQYTEPWPRVVLADGERIWLYDEELQQVTVRLMSGVLAQTPAGLLAGDASALDLYTYTGEQTAAGQTVIRLIPIRAGGDFRLIHMRFSDGLLLSLTLDDQFRQETHIAFHKITLNPDIADARFTFVVPEDADVIDETGS